MLKKNKDYVEFTLQYTSVDWARSKDCPEVCLKGYSDFSFPGVPIMDVVCNEFDHKVVVVSKRDFERLQTENEELKKKLEEFSPAPGYREFLRTLYSEDDVEKLEWTLNHICGGKASVNGWIAVSLFWKQNYETLSKLVGFSSVEEIQDYLTNEAECDTLREAMLKLIDENKYVCEEWCKAGELIEKWRKATGYLRPEDISTDSMISKSMANEINTANEKLWRENEKCEKRIESLTSKCTVLEQEIKIYTKALKDWKKITGCPSPLAAKTLIDSAMSYVDGYHEAQKENRKLTEEVDSWKNVTGYSTPEDYMHARISGAFHTPFDYTAAWQKATGCDTPEAAKCRINNLIGEAEAWESDYNHLLALTGFDNEGEIEDFLEQNNDRNKLTTVIDNLKLENETMKTALRASNFAMQKELDQEIDKWQKATGRTDPEAAKQYIDRLKGRLNKIHSYSVDC